MIFWKYIAYFTNLFPVAGAVGVPILVVSELLAPRLVAVTLTVVVVAPEGVLVAEEACMVASFLFVLVHAHVDVTARMATRTVRPIDKYLLFI